MFWFFLKNNLSEEKKNIFSLSFSLAGPHNFRGMNMTAEEFEYLLGKTGAIKTEITSDPRPQVKDVMMSALGTVSKNLFKKCNFLEYSSTPKSRFNERARQITFVH